MEATYQALRDCPTCDGEGHHLLDHDHPTAELRPVPMYETPPCEESGCAEVTCGVYGAPCEPCEGIGTISEGVDCEACEGEGVIPCESCGGEGTRPDHCGQCHEEIEERHYFEVSCYLGDGEIYCTSCAFEMYQCEACEGEGRVALEPVEDPQNAARKVAAVPGMCSCCAANPRAKGDPSPYPSVLGRSMGYDWFVYDARVVDVDGIYFARLCGDADGLGGCLDEAERAGPDDHHGAKMVADLLGDDTDGAESVLADFRYVGLID